MTRTNIFLFPAFVLRYLGNEHNVINSNNNDFDKRIKIVSDLSQSDFSKFNIEDDSFMQDELKNQLATYLISCTYSDILESRQIEPQRLAYLSMGLYASLYCGKSISFEDGVGLIISVFEKMQDILRNNKYGMLNVIGLEQDDINEIIKRENLACEVVIKNSSYSFIISGESKSIIKFKQMAEDEGAMQVRIFPVNTAYHSTYVNRIKEYKSDIIKDFKIKELKTPLLSTLKKKYINSSEEIAEEIISNLINPVDWETCMKELNCCNDAVFYECGPGNSLNKIARFINENIVFVKIY